MEITYDSINAAILNKARLILSKKDSVKEYTNICLRARVCPNCGKNLKYYKEDNKYECQHCNWYYNEE